MKVLLHNLMNQLTQFMVYDKKTGKPRIMSLGPRETKAIEESQITPEIRAKSENGWLKIRPTGKRPVPNPLERGEVAPLPEITTVEQSEAPPPPKKASKKTKSTTTKRRGRPRGRKTKKD